MKAITKSISLLLVMLLAATFLYSQDPNPDQPLPTIYHDMLYHDSLNQVLQFSGIPGHGWGGEVEEIWNFDGVDKKWKFEGVNRAKTYVNPIGQKTEVPATSPAYDRESNRVIFFNRVAKTWAYHPESESWEQKSPALAPKGRCGHNMVYDAESDRMILFGGFGCKSANDPVFNDTWAYDFNTDTWEEMKPDTTPGKRMYAAMVYNDELDRIYLWGARNFGSVESDNDLWEYDYNSDSWVVIQNTTGPADPYAYTSMVYHPGNNEIFLYGGSIFNINSSGSCVDESWIYDCTARTWELISTENAPARLSNHSMAYIPEKDEILLFGGEVDLCYSNTIMKGTWVLDYESKSWREVLFAYAGKDAIYCATDLDQIIIGGSPTAWGGAKPYNYAWSGEVASDGLTYTASDLLDSTDIGNPGFISHVDSLTLFLEVSDAMGSVARDTATFRFSSFEVCPDDWQAAITEGDSVQLAHCIEGGLGPLAYQWLPADDLSDPDVSDPWASPNSDATYELVITDTLGCEMKSTFIIDVSGVNVEEHPMKGSMVTIFSDPSTSQITISAENPGLEPINLQILSISGAIMDQVLIYPGSIEIRLATYSPGVYLYRLTDQKEYLGSGKFILH